MKVRSGFVSNSSSSSFVIIGNGSFLDPNVSHELNVPQDLGGELEFGWGPETITDIGSRINFAYLQAQYVNKTNETLLEKAMEATGEYHPWFIMLENVLKKNLGVGKINWNIMTDSYTDEFGGYIDHQSSSREGKNTEIFDSEEILEQFIFASDSKIELDNDNY